MKTLQTFILLSAISFFACIGICNAQSVSVIRSSANGTIDWSSHTVTSKGSATPVRDIPLPPTDRQNRLIEIAKQNALDNLYKTIETIYLDSSSPLKAIISGQKELEDHLLAMVHNAAITKKEYLSDGSVELEVSLSLNGGFGQLMLPEGIKQIQPVKTLSPAASAPETDLDETESALSAPEPPVFTGLIIDARGLEISPVLSPKLLNEDGNEAYGPAYISREFAVQRGTVAYHYTIKNSADSALRVGNNPLIVKGIKTSGAIPADIVISNADASRLHSSSEHLKFLNHCNVSILIDKP